MRTPVPAHDLCHWQQLHGNIDAISSTTTACEQSGKWSVKAESWAVEQEPHGASIKQ